jgi:hypothetical protein
MGSAPEQEENQRQGKSIIKWKSCCGAVGKWTSVDLENG